MRHVALYHRTSRQAARAILTRGFRDTSGYYGTARRTSGMWLSDRPLNSNEGTSEGVLLRVILRVSGRELHKYEWREAGKPYREWQMPAVLVNRQCTSVSVIPWWRE